MIRTKVIKILVILIVTACCFATAAHHLYAADQSVQTDAALEDYTAYLDAGIPALMGRYAIPGASLALVRDGRIVWTGSYGYADVESGERMAEDMPMRVQSISKSLTAWAVMKLAESGRINIDAPIKQYLKDWTFPESAYPTDQITVRQLLTHRSGMPLGDVFAMYSPGAAMPSLRESLSGSAVLRREPGTQFAYSNVGYNLLELLIEEVTQQTFSDYMQTEILTPLGMKNASFLFSEAIASDIPTGYSLSGEPVQPYVYPEKASGGLYATAADIAAFTLAGMPDFSHQEVLSAASVSQLYQVQSSQIGVYGLAFDAYAMGYYVERLSGGETAVSHGGQGSGWMSHFHAVPEKGDAIVILTNSQRSWPFIAGVLNGWARWCGYSAPGMTRILLGEALLWAIVGLILSLSAFEIGKFVMRLVRGGRSASVSLGRLLCAVVLLAGLTWCLCQKYLFITTIFPKVSVWLGISLAVFAASLPIGGYKADKRQADAVSFKTGVAHDADGCMLR